MQLTLEVNEKTRQRRPFYSSQFLIVGRVKTRRNNQSCKRKGKEPCPGLALKKDGSSGFRMGNRAKALSVRGAEGLGDCTAEALRSRRKEFFRRYTSTRSMRPDRLLGIAASRPGTSGSRSSRALLGATSRITPNLVCERFCWNSRLAISGHENVKTCIRGT